MTTFEIVVELLVVAHNQPVPSPCNLDRIQLDLENSHLR